MSALVSTILVLGICFLLLIFAIRAVVKKDHADQGCGNCSHCREKQGGQHCDDGCTEKGDGNFNKR